MSIFTKKQFNDYIYNSKIDLKIQVYLIYGDKFLVNQSMKKIINTILPKSIGSFDVETFYDNYDDIIRLANSINTFSLLQNGKLIILHSSKMFKSKNEEKIQTKENYKYGSNNLTKTEGLSKNVPSLTSICTSMNNSIIESPELKKLNILKNSSSLIIKNIIDKGFPNKHYLILLADTINKQTSLFKTINDKGIVLDCSIYGSGTQYNQKFLIYEVINKLLSENNKIIDRVSYKIFYHNIVDLGIDTFSKIFAKLVDYVGEEKHIRIEDIKEIFEKNKKKPIFDLTNSIAKQDLRKSLFCLKSLLSNKVHPLQIVVSIANKTRKLILAKDFILHDNNRTWQSNQTFTHFKTNTLEAVKKYDRNTQNILAQLSNIFELKVGNLEHINSSMLLLAGKNSYTAYMTILEADKLKESLLFDTMKILEKADKKLKSQNTNPKNILESVIFSICNL